MNLHLHLYGNLFLQEASLLGWQRNLHVSELDLTFNGLLKTVKYTFYSLCIFREMLFISSNAKELFCLSVKLERIRPQTPVLKTLGCFMEAICKIFVRDD